MFSVSNINMFISFNKKIDITDAKKKKKLNGREQRM